MSNAPSVGQGPPIPPRPPLTAPELATAIRQRLSSIADYDDSMANDLDFAVTWLKRAVELLEWPE